MISMEEWTTIRCLFNKGISQRQISKLLNISRNTVSNAIKSNNSPKYNIEKIKPSSLEKYKDQIENMFFNKNYIGSRILNELRDMGYKGGKSAFYNYFSKIVGGKRINKISQPYETQPGIQAQFDWSPYTVYINNILTKVIVFSTILGYSRKRKYVGSLSEDQESVFTSIEEGFGYFGGIPQELLVDNAKQMVTNPNPKYFEWNKKFLEFCGYYGVTPKHCKIRTAKTKGKVENPFYYLEQHFIKGNNFKDFNDFEKKLEVFNEEVNNKIHSSLKITPDEKFLEEKHYLNKIPDKPFAGVQEVFRKVNWDCLLSFEGNKYSVPHHYAGKSVWIKKIKGVVLRIYSQKGIIIAEHSLSGKKGEVVMNNKHYEGLYTFKPQSLSFLKEKFNKYYPQNYLFLEKLLACKKLSPVRHLKRILSMRDFYSDNDMGFAFSKCLEWNNFNADVFIGVLRNHCEVSKPELLTKHRLELPKTENIQRDLNEYEYLY
jgi:transposase